MVTIVVATLAVAAGPLPADAAAYPGGNGRLMYVAGREVRVVDAVGLSR